MHDKNGKLLVERDFVKHITYVGGKERTVIAQILACIPNTETCNISLAVPYPTIAVREEWATASKVEKVDV